MRFLPAAKTMEPANQNSAKYWSDFLLKEFAKETDRAAVILTTSLIENALTTLLQSYLAPVSERNDEFFEGANAPLSTFSSKIQLAYRLSLLSNHFANDLNLIRKLRNEFAHNVHGSNLDAGKAKDYLTTLIASSKIVINNPLGRSLGIFPFGSRGDFLMIAHIILWYLHTKIDEITQKRIPVASEEWIYNWKYEEPQTVSPSQPTQNPPTESG